MLSCTAAAKLQGRMWSINVQECIESDGMSIHQSKSTRGSCAREKGCGPLAAAAPGGRRGAAPRGRSAPCVAGEAHMGKGEVGQLTLRAAVPKKKKKTHTPWRD